MFYSPLNGTGCDCLAEQMRRATPSMHCSFSPSRSFSFFFPNRMTETWKLRVRRDRGLFMGFLRELTFLFLFFCSKAEGHSVRELACLWIKWKSPHLREKTNKSNLLARKFSTRNASSSPEDSWTCSWHCSFPYPTLLSGSSPSHHLSVLSKASSQPAAPLAPW